MIEVAVTGGRLRALLRWGGLLAVLMLGRIGRFGGEFWALGMAIIRRGREANRRLPPSSLGEARDLGAQLRDPGLVCEDVASSTG